MSFRLPFQSTRVHPRFLVGSCCSICIVFCRLFFFFLVLFVLLRCTDSAYPFAIFKFFLLIYLFICSDKLIDKNRDIIPVWFLVLVYTRDCRDRDRIVIACITTIAISAYHHWSCGFESGSDEVYSIQYYVIKFVREM